MHRYIQYGGMTVIVLVGAGAFVWPQSAQAEKVIGGDVCQLLEPSQAAAITGATSPTEFRLVPVAPTGSCMYGNQSPGSTFTKSGTVFYDHTNAESDFKKALASFERSDIGAERFSSHVIDGNSGFMACDSTVSVVGVFKGDSFVQLSAYDSEGLDQVAGCSEQTIAVAADIMRKVPD
jgi:hypothetical protein